MESPVVTEIAHGCERAGFESLRFNWRGVGASQGEMTDDEGVAVADYAASLDWIEDSVEGPIAACGYSFGAAAAARVASKRPRVRRLLLVAPPPALLDRGSLESFGGHTLVVAGDRDAVSPVAELESIVALLPHASLEVVDGTDHFFMTSLRELGHLVRGFLGRGE